MASKLATVGGAALALLMVSSLPVAGFARGGGGGHGGGGAHFGGGGHMGGFGGGHFGGPRMGAPLHFAPGGAHFANRPFHERRFHNRRAFFFAPAFDYDYGYGSGCYWLRRNALSTGSPYWWNRYNACVDGY